MYTNKEPGWTLSNDAGKGTGEKAKEGKDTCPDGHSTVRVRMLGRRRWRSFGRRERIAGKSRDLLQHFSNLVRLDGDLIGIRKGNTQSRTRQQSAASNQPRSGITYVVKASFEAFGFLGVASIPRDGADRL